LIRARKRAPSQPRRNTASCSGRSPVRSATGFNFTDENSHNLGIGWDDNKVDSDGMVTKNPEDTL
jgi:hypothetical protein